MWKRLCIIFIVFLCVGCGNSNENIGDYEKMNSEKDEKVVTRETEEKLDVEQPKELSVFDYQSYVMIC